MKTTGKKAPRDANMTELAVGVRVCLDNGSEGEITSMGDHAESAVSVAWDKGPDAGRRTNIHPARLTKLNA